MRLTILIIVFGLVMTSCEEELVQESSVLDSHRLFNFTDYSGGALAWQMTINKKPFQIISAGQGETGDFSNTTFPRNGKADLDEGLLREGDNEINVRHYFNFGRLDTVLSLSPGQKNNFYLYEAYYYGYRLAVQKQELPPSMGKFKIRVFNTASTHQGSIGKVSLAYDNKEIVAPQLTDVPEETFSDFIEMDYGTYKFRVLNAKIGEITHLPQGSKSRSLLSRSLPDDVYTGAHLFKPGGIYTIVVNLNRSEDAEGYYQFHIVEEDFFIQDAVCKVSVFNASTVFNTIRVDVDNVMFNNIDFGEQSQELQCGTGVKRVKVSNTAGIVLYEKDIALGNLRNVTILFGEKDGEPHLELLDHNLIIDRGVKVRFVNLSTDVDKISFINSNIGIDESLASNVERWAIQEEEYGTTQESSVYLYWGPQVKNNGLIPINLRVSKTSPYEEPVSILPDVAVEYPFVRNQSVYADKVPRGETGVYTVLFIGKNNSPATSIKARVVVLSHGSLK